MSLGRRVRGALGVGAAVLVLAVTATATGGGASSGPGAVGRAGPTRIEPVVVPKALQGVRTSPNWAGWAATGSFESVSASWIEPSVTCTSANSTVDYWVGLDGAGTPTVEQIGTEAVCQGGKHDEGDWYDMYPALAVDLGDRVQSGDHLTAGVTTDGHGTFVMTLSDSTAGFTQLVRGVDRSAVGRSAEVITEAPTPEGSDTGAFALTHFAAVTYTSAKANGQALGTLDPVSFTMQDGPGGPVKAAPGPLLAGTSFTVTWEHR